MSRNLMTAIIVILIAALAVIGYMYYQDQQSNSLDISVSEDGISMDAN